MYVYGCGQDIATTGKQRRGYLTYRMIPIYMYTHIYLENNLFVKKGEEIWNILIPDTPC